MNKVSLSINGRFLGVKFFTGVQRYAFEITRNLLNYIKIKNIEVLVSKSSVFAELPVKRIGRFKGHLWEQIDLPMFLRMEGSPLLVNLANTAPIFYSNQIVTVCDVAFLRNPFWFSRRFVTYYKFLIPKLVKKAKKVITISKFSKREICDLMGVDSSKVEVVYCGVSEIAKAQELVRPSKLPNWVDKYFLCVCSWDPRKNLKRLMEAFILMNKKDIPLVLAGGSYHNVFSSKNLISKYVANSRWENIICLGYVSDSELAYLYKNALCFVYPSLYEGFGLPPLEAMSYGCPVIVSNVASLPEVCGEAAIYVDPYEVDDITKSMVQILEDIQLREDLKSKAVKRAKEFSWDKSAQKLAKIIKEVLR